MASAPPPPPPPPAAGADGIHFAEAGAAVASYSARLWRAILAMLPSSDSIHPRRILRLSPWGSSSRTRRRRRQRLGLPLPLRSRAVEFSLVTTEASRLLGVSEDILDHILSSLHNIQKNLQFWESRAEGTYGQKLYFMVFERGPKAFVEETIHLVSRWGAEGSSMQRLHHSAAITIFERISVLTSLQNCLAIFLAQVYTEIDKHGEGLTKDFEKSVPLLLVAINGLFTELEESISHTKEIYEGEHSMSLAGWSSCAPSFAKIPEIDRERSYWTDAEIGDAISLIYQNLDHLDTFTSLIVSKCEKPHSMNLHWIRYTCGAVGLSFCSMWLLRHSRLMGSSDIDNWVREAKDSTIGFWKSHVEQPLLSIRDELFETFRRRHKGVIEYEEVQLTSNSLHRMLLAFSEQTTGRKFPEDTSDQEMLEIVMSRYEKELIHPLQNLIGGELPRALLIQIQKVKLDLETAMLELDQILKANEINFAILAALPAFFLSVTLVMLAQAWIRKDRGAEGRGRIARTQRRLLAVDIRRKIMHFQMCKDQGREKDAQCIFGLVLYRLDRLYKSVERHAKETGEWLSLKRAIMDLGNPGLETQYKLAFTSQILSAYSCMLPSSQV